VKIDQTRLFEIVGILAVVVSLVFVTLELRNNTNAINSQTNQGLAELNTTVSVSLMENPELADLWIRGTNDPESLTEVEQFRYRMIKDSVFNTWEQAFNLRMNYGVAGTIEIYVIKVTNSIGDKIVKFTA